MIDRIRVRRDDRATRIRLIALGAAAGTAVGLVLGRLFDPAVGRRRRKEIRDRTAGAVRRSGRRVGRFGRHSVSHAHGLAERAKHRHEEPKDLDDATLTDKIETQIFRPADVPKGQINVNVQKGVVQLRGEVPSHELIDDLEDQVRKIQGVRDVENLLHVPGVAPHMHQ
jgi:osmotically-inducible protein OsmY